MPEYVLPVLGNLKRERKKNLAVNVEDRVLFRGGPLIRIHFDMLNRSRTTFPTNFQPHLTRF
jgi:hypothetical protein